MSEAPPKPCVRRLGSARDRRLRQTRRLPYRRRFYLRSLELFRSRCIKVQKELFCVLHINKFSPTRIRNSRFYRSVFVLYRPPGIRRKVKRKPVLFTHMNMSHVPFRLIWRKLFIHLEMNHSDRRDAQTQRWEVCSTKRQRGKTATEDTYQRGGGHCPGTWVG